MPKLITFSVHSENGKHNPTFRWDMIAPALNFLGRYWDITFLRNNGGRIKFINSAANKPVQWAAWTNGFDCRISNSYNFNNPSPNFAAYLTAKVVCHEFGHMCRPGGQHASVPGLMDTSASMPTGNLAQNDCINWFDRAYTKTGNPRPWLEPNLMRKTFIPNFVGATEFGDGPELEFGCGHEPISQNWFQKLFGSKTP